MKKILIITVVVMLLLLLSVSVSYAAPPASGGVHHTVRYGETLFSLGRYYGVNPYHIAKVNGLPNPDCIYAGQVLFIPSGHGQPGQNPCWGGGSGCPPPGGGHNPPVVSPYQGGYGYNYIGYYYQHYPNYRRYSHTCGYYQNCY